MANRLHSQGSEERCGAPAYFFFLADKTGFLISHSLRTVCTRKHVYIHVFIHRDVYTHSETGVLTLRQADTHEYIQRYA